MFMIVQENLYILILATKKKKNVGQCQQMYIGNMNTIITYIHPHLEFCIKSWIRYLIKYIPSLEQIQIRTIKLVLSIIHLSHTRRF